MSTLSIWKFDTPDGAAAALRALERSETVLRHAFEADDAAEEPVR